MTTTRRRPRAINSRQVLDQQVSESGFQVVVVKTAQLFGFRCQHVYDSRLASAHVDAGFPDWIFAKEGRVIAVELKTERGAVSMKQHDWLYHLGATGAVECYIWRPHDWSSGRIERIFAGLHRERRGEGGYARRDSAG